MIVCHCRVVNDKEIRQHIEAGAADVDEVTELCGAGSDCGGCHGLIREMLARPAEQVALA